MNRTDELAQALVQARRRGHALDDAAWADALPDAAAAYAVQDAVATAFGWFASDPVRAWKSGGPSRDAVLTHAALPPQGVRPGPADFGDMAFHELGIEAEIALRLAVDVTPERARAAAHADVPQLVDAMAVAIEIVDSRWTRGAAAPALLRLADLQSHGALVLGAWMPLQPSDWTAQRVEVRIGGAEPRTFIGTHSLGDPTWLVPAWLQHVTRDGAMAPAGTVVTTGTWCGLLPARKGDAVRVAFDGLVPVETRL